MKCQQKKEAIDLFDDLTVDQKKEVDAHLQHCESCRAYFEEVSEFNSVIRLAALQKPKPTDPDRLLNRTMMHITSEETFLEKVISSLQWIKDYWFRISLVSTSLVMLIVFYFEFSYSSHSSYPASIRQANMKEMIRLDGTLLKTNFKQRLEKASAAAPCYSIAKRQIDKDCIKEKYGFNDI